MTYYLNTEKLASLVRRQRGSRGLRDIAREIGSVSPSTLSRVEKAKSPDLDTFFTLCNWLKISPTEFIGNDEKAIESDTSEAEAIANSLRADNRLDSSVADVLSSLVKVAYRDFTRKDKSKIDEHKEDVVSSSQYTLEGLLAGACSEEFAGEYDWGRSMGKEIW